VRKTKPHRGEKDTNCETASHVHTDETKLKKFLQLNQVPSKHDLLLS